MKSSEFIKRFQESVAVIGGDPDVAIEVFAPLSEVHYAPAAVEVINCIAVDGGWRYSDRNCSTQIIKIW